MVKNRFFEPQGVLSSLGFLAALLFWSMAFGPSAYSQQPMSSSRGGHEHILYLPIPGDLSRQDVVNAGPLVTDRLREAVWARLASRAQSVQDAVQMEDTIIVFVDHDGQPIHANLEAARAGVLTTPAPSSNNLTFTYNSIYNSWTAEELALVTSAVNACYPVAKEIYGPPAFNIVVNIAKVPSAGAGNYYYSNSGVGQIAIGSVTSDVVCHEMLHAFRDDDIIGLDTFEEGMVRAAEVEILDRLTAFPYWDRYHSYSFDVDYEALNRRAIGSPGGNFSAGYVGTLLRYNLAGYAWAKAVIEHTGFLANFNREYYARALADPTTWSAESKLVHIAATVQPLVEGKPFTIWYGLQGVLSTSPPMGYFLYSRGSGEPDYTIDFFFRSSSGSEIMQANSLVQWRFFDHAGNLLDLGSGTTSALGWVDVPPNFPEGCNGRIMLVTTAHAPDGSTVSDTSVWSRGCSGVFGVVPSADTGKVWILSLDNFAQYSADVVNGAFSVPTLKAIRGRFLAVFYRCPTCWESVLVKDFNKDASDYFLIMDR